MDFDEVPVSAKRQVIHSFSLGLSYCKCGLTYIYKPVVILRMVDNPCFGLANELNNRSEINAFKAKCVHTYCIPARFA